MVNTERSNAKIFALSISEKRGTIKYNVEGANFVENYGIENDAHAGDWHRQISLLSIESIEKFNANSNFKVNPGEFSENVTTQGIELLTTLPIGSMIKIGNDVLLKVTQHGKKCHTDCAVFKTVGKCIMPTEGIFATVLKGGKVRVGDSIHIQLQKDGR